MRLWVIFHRCKYTKKIEIDKYLLKFFDEFGCFWCKIFIKSVIAHQELSKNNEDNCPRCHCYL